MCFMAVDLISTVRVLASDSDMDAAVSNLNTRGFLNWFCDSSASSGGTVPSNPSAFFNSCVGEGSGAAQKVSLVVWCVSSVMRCRCLKKGSRQNLATLARSQTEPNTHISRLILERGNDVLAELGPDFVVHIGDLRTRESQELGAPLSPQLCEDLACFIII